MMIALTGLVLGTVGAILMGISAYLTTSLLAGEATPNRPAIRSAAQSDEEERNHRTLPTLTSTPSPTATKPTPTLEPTSTLMPGDSSAENEEQPDDNVTSTPAVTETLSLTIIGPQNQKSDTVAKTDEVTPAEIIEPTPTDDTYVDPYTSTNQVQPPPSAQTEWAAFSCPITSAAVFDLIPIEGRPLADHPDYLHADLNLTLRGYQSVSETLALEFYNGNADPNAPQLRGLFEPHRGPQIGRVYQINEWIWDAGKCEGNARGCRGGPLDVFWPVTLVGVTTTPGEPVYIPERGPQIYSGGFVGMVLYAEENQITLAYTRRDSIAAGYTVHLQNLCVDPNLLALYRAQKNADGWHTTGFLPALRNNQSLGVALGDELRVTIRDAGSFMDPRSEKDWWRQ